METPINELIFSDYKSPTEPRDFIFSNHMLCVKTQNTWNCHKFLTLTDANYFLNTRYSNINKSHIVKTTLCKYMPTFLKKKILQYKIYQNQNLIEIFD